MKHLLLSAALLVAASPTFAQSLPAGVSRPVIAPTDLVYPGCPIPPTTFRYIWYFDPVNGNTPAAYAAMNPPIPMPAAGQGPTASTQGSAAHPWNSLSSLTGVKVNGQLGPVSGYPSLMLSTVYNSGGPIGPGDEVLLMSGNYGAFGGGGLSQAAAEIINNPPLTITAAPGQKPIFTSINFYGTSGMVIHDVAVTSHDTGGSLVYFADADIAGSTNTNIVLYNMTISSDTVANIDAWTQAQWVATAPLFAVNLNGSTGGTGLTCASITNSHMWGTYQNVLMFADNSLAQNNESDHFADDGFDYGASNLALINNYIHDPVNDGTGAHHMDGIQGEEPNSPNPPATPNVYPEANIYIDRNLVLDIVDTNNPFPTYLQGIDAFDGDWTNVIVENNEIATSSCWGITEGSIHNGFISNNRVIDTGITADEPGCNAVIAVQETHEGSTSTNTVITSNLASGIVIGGDLTVTANQNVAYGVGYPAFIGSLGQEYNTAGVVGPATVYTGNTLDGKGAVNEFASTTSPYNFTLLPASPGVALGIPAAAPIPPSNPTLPVGVSIPSILSTDLVYPGCPLPPTTFGNVWVIDPINGHTPAAYAAMNPPVPFPTAGQPATSAMQGSAAHPWDSLPSLFGVVINGSLQPVPGYPGLMLSTVWNSGGPIRPGDEVLLNSGNYGDIGAGSLSNPGAEIINSPALTIAPAPGQTPVINSLWLAEISGLVLNGLTVQSNKEPTNGNPLISIMDGNVAGVVNSNIILESMTVRSDTVANMMNWTQAQWLAQARQGINIVGSNDGAGMSCVSVVKSHVTGTHTYGSAAIHVGANNQLVQNNEVDHFGNNGIQFDASNVAVLSNNIHDPIQTGPSDYGDVHAAIQGEVGGGAPGDNVAESNIYISGNQIVDQVDPAIPPALQDQLLEGIESNNGDWTNVVITWNRTATSGAWSIATGNSHNGIVANNLAIDGKVLTDESGVNPEIAAIQSHENTCCNAGVPPTNISVYNNVAPSFGWNGVGVTGSYNVSTGISLRPAYGYATGSESATVGQITTASAASGVSNIMDGMGVQTNEFVGVPAPGSLPMSPAPNWALVPGSPAATNQTTPAPPIDAPTLDAPTIPDAPSISGPPVVGQTLTANVGTWTNCPCTYTFGWHYPGTPVNPTLTSSTITLLAGYVGYQMAVDVTATNSVGSTTLTAVTAGVITAH